MAFFYMSGQEKRGALVVSLLLVFLIVTCVLMCRLSGDGGSNADVDSLQSDSVTSVRNKKNVHQRYDVTPTHYETFDFDPNTADSTTLLRLGLSPFMVRNIYRYRARGGRYSTPESFARTYGMTNELWDRLRPHIIIDRRYQMVDVDSIQRQNANLQSVVPSVHEPAPANNKISAGQTVDLNTADSVTLLSVPGIGEYRAHLILNYRHQLGGYVSVSQLLDIDQLPEDLQQWFTVETPQVRHININKATKRQLTLHPYIRVYRAKSIWDHRHNRGNILSLEQLRSLPGFSDEDVARLAPYLEF